MVNLLEAIKDRVSHRKRTRLADYAALVRRLVDDGQAVDPDEAARILDESDHDADQLAGDVETARQRKAWRQKIDALPGLEREESEVRAKAEAENAKLRAAEKKHTEAVWPLDNRLIEIGKARAEAQAAKADLIRTASDALKRQAAEVQSEAGEVERQKAELRNAIHEHEDFVLQFGKQEAVNHIHPGDLSELQRVRAKLLELRAKLAALDGDTAKLAKQSAEIAEQMLCL